MSAVDLSHVIASAADNRSLLLRSDLSEPRWEFWERRTLNIHRVVGLWKARHGFGGATELASDVRGVVGRHFKRSWWRGMAFGVVVEVGSIQLSGADLESLVDIRDNRKGTLQWIVLVSSLDPVALGVHTWVEGFLSPVYRGVLRGVADAGYEVGSTCKGKDAVMEILTTVTDLHTAVKTLGLKGTKWSDFRNEW